MPNRDGSKTSLKAFFGDAEYVFDLVDPSWKILIELEEKVGSIFPFFDRLRIGDFRVMQLRDCIRLGLIGGGMAPSGAHKLLVTYFDASPMHESVAIGIGITAAAMFGTGEDGNVLAPEAADQLAEEVVDDTGE